MVTLYSFKVGVSNNELYSSEILTQDVSEEVFTSSFGVTLPLKKTMVIDVPQETFTVIMSDDLEKIQLLHEGVRLGHNMTVAYNKTGSPCCNPVIDNKNHKREEVDE